MRIGETKEALAAFGPCLLADLEEEDYMGMGVVLFNVSTVLTDENRLATEERCVLLLLDLNYNLSLPLRTSSVY